MPLFTNATATRYRPNARAIGADFKPAAKTYSTATARVHHEPADGKTREVLPEGIRDDVTRVVFVAAGWLRAPDVATGIDADELDIPGEGRFLVVMLDNHNTTALRHDRAFLSALPDIAA